jgi:oligosaccharide amylase
MARAVTLGNGNMLIGLDYRGQVRDFYFPYVGHSNHVSGASGSFVHRIGVYVDDTLMWLDDPSWNIVVGSEAETVVGSLHAVNDTIGVSLTSSDAVHNEKNIFIRSFTVTNERKDKREIKLFISQQFRISESRRGDTGFYDPRVGAIIHYKGHCNFLVNAFHKGEQFKDYNIGLFGIEGKEGTYHDAYDGKLERNPIEHGSVDSVIGITCNLDGLSATEINYWIVCGETIAAVHDLNKHVIDETPDRLLASTKNYWNAWLEKEDRDLSLLSPELKTLFNRSLTTIRVHTDNNGAIIASSDTDMLHHGRDTYSYVWPRDGAYIAHALDRLGYSDVAERFFTFFSDKLERDGYLMHKYRSDGTLGSSWHPWMQNGVAQLPIQEDETAIILFMLWRHYDVTHNVEFIESLYNTFIEKAAEFLCEFIRPEYGLPENSYDLWEEKYGISTYTSSCVYGGLIAAAHFANMLGKEEPARRYSAIAQRMQSSITEHLWNRELGMFIKQIHASDTEDAIYDHTVDLSSFFGPLYFGVIDPDDERVEEAFKTIEKTLQVGNTDAYVRYERDNYYTMQEAGSPNPWVITTLWVAQYLIMKAKKVKELERPYKILEWTCSHATKGGVLPEQMHPHTGEHLSTAPLIWSHAEFAITVDDYIKKYQELTGKTKKLD